MDDSEITLPDGTVARLASHTFIQLRLPMEPPVLSRDVDVALVRILDEAGQEVLVVRYDGTTELPLVPRGRYFEDLGDAAIAAGLRDLADAAAEIQAQAQRLARVGGPGANMVHLTEPVRLACVAAHDGLVEMAAYLEERF